MHDGTSSQRMLMGWRETAPEVRTTLIGSLGLAVLGALAAVRIFTQVRSIYRLPVFFHQFVVHDLPGSLLSAAIIVVALLFYRRLPVPLRALDYLDHYRYYVAGGVAVLLAIGTLTVYHNHPLSVDESAQLFQARIFADGRIWAKYPPELLDWLLPYTSYGFFKTGSAGGEVICDYWPGLSLLQTPFVLIGAPWLLNPLLGAGTLVLIRRLAGELYPDTSAPAWAMLLTLASPVFIVSCISYYEMPAHLFLNLLFTFLILQGTPHMLLAAGVVGSLALVVKNPVPHILYATPWIAWLALRRGGWRALIWLAVGYAPLSLLIGFGWAALRLDLAAQAPAQAKTVYEDPARLLSIFSASAFTRVVYYRILALLKLAAWAVPGLIILAVFGARSAWKDRRVRVLAVSLVLTYAGYFLFKVTQGHGWGYRHVHGAWGTLPLLACALVARKRDDAHAGVVPVVHLTGLLAVLSLVLLNGLRLFQVDAWMDRHLSQLPPLDASRAQVCFIRPWEGYYAVDLVQNDPFLRHGTIFLKSHGLESEKPFMEQHFCDAVPADLGAANAVWDFDRPSSELGNSAESVFRCNH